MLPRDTLLSLAEENQKVIVAAVRLLAEMQRRGGPVSQSQVPDIAQISSLVFEDIKQKLAKFFPLRGGRFHFPEAVAKPDPWDLDDPKSKQADRALATLRSEHERMKADDPRTRLILRMQALFGGDFRAAEKQFFFLSRSHSFERVDAAVARAEALSPRPNEPMGYLLSQLKNGSFGVLGQTKSGQPRTVFAFQKPANAEYSKSEIIGWEAATKFNPDGSVIWPDGARRMIWRLRSGHIQYTAARDGETPPSHTDDPGFIVR
ncbi:hypothetical protein [uncultured Bosea sp.]|uniref:hypothetical protein n=1 Tax=uncultured Bosea sp. TaxID=211457 RepID=UPI0025F6031C|nr:hypothetical protein [uncultured Bosea sp.]